MANENLNSDEDYLDRLLRSVSSDKNESDNDIDAELDAGDFDADEDFDFDEEINSLEKSLDIEDDKEFDISDILSGAELSDEDIPVENSVESIDESLDTSIDNAFDETSVESIDNAFDETSVESIDNAFEDTTAETIVESIENTYDEPLDEEGLEDISDIENVFSNNDASGEETATDNITPELDADLLASIDDMMNTSEEENGDKESVDEAIKANDSSSPEDDLKGLMDILSAGNEVVEEAAEATTKKKKKKGLFSFFKRKKKNDDVEDLDTDSDSAEAIGDSEVGNIIKSSSTEKDVNMADVISGDMPDLAELGISFDTLQQVDESNNGDISGLDDIFSLSEEENYDENEELIKQMDRGEIDEEELLEDAEDDKKKKKKEKKEKTPKEKKPKKPKKVKEKKPKKVKEKKEDVIIPIPKVFLIFAFSFLVLLVVVLIFGGNLTHYNTCINNATGYYVDKKYSEAYSAISGLEPKEEDAAFFTQVETVMFVMRHYEAGKNLTVIGDYENALDSLLKGVRTFDKYQNVGRDFKCYDDMANVLEWIDIELEKVFGITESDARNLNNIEDREEYAYEVRLLAKNARLKNNPEE